MHASLAHPLAIHLLIDNVCQALSEDAGDAGGKKAQCGAQTRPSGWAERAAMSSPAGGTAEALTGPWGQPSACPGRACGVESVSLTSARVCVCARVHACVRVH